MDNDSNSWNEKCNKIKNLMIVETVNVLAKEVEAAKRNGVSAALLDSEAFLLYLNGKIGESLKERMKKNLLDSNQELAEELITSSKKRL